LKEPSALLQRHWWRCRSQRLPRAKRYRWAHSECKIHNGWVYGPSDYELSICHPLTQSCDCRSSGLAACFGTASYKSTLQVESL